MQRHAALTSSSPQPHHRPDRAKAKAFLPKPQPGRFLTPPPIQTPPRGWCAEQDRREEFADLSYNSLMFKSLPLNDA